MAGAGDEYYYGGPGPRGAPHGLLLAVVVGLVVAGPLFLGDGGEVLTEAVAELLSPVSLLLLPVCLLFPSPPTAAPRRSPTSSPSAGPPTPSTTWEAPPSASPSCSSSSPCSTIAPRSSAATAATTSRAGAGRGGLLCRGQGAVVGAISGRLCWVCYEWNAKVREQRGIE